MIVQRKNVTAFLLGLVAVGLAGCGSAFQDYNPWKVAEWRQMEPRRDVNYVEMVALDHVVSFRPNAIRLDPAERGRLRRFVHNGSIKSTDEIAIHAPAAAEGEGAQIARARVDFLRREFLALGLPADVFYSQAGTPLSTSDQVAIVAHRALTLPPDCSNSDPILPGRPSWKVGCTTAAALGTMVADPRDLVRGRPTGPADGHAASKAIEGYRDPAKFEQKPQKIIIEATQ
jgi:pilus biogenesis lipoprotein CpaD